MIKKLLKTDLETTVKFDKNYPNIVESLDIPKFKTGSDDIVDNRKDPALKVALKCRQHPRIFAIND